MMACTECSLCMSLRERSMDLLVFIVSSAASLTDTLTLSNQVFDLSNACDFVPSNATPCASERTSPLHRTKKAHAHDGEGIPLRRVKKPTHGEGFPSRSSRRSKQVQ